MPGTQQQLVNATDILSVRDFITTAINGVTVNQAGIVEAVATAKAQGQELFWPAGTYVSDANIPHFHSVRHYGTGIIKRGSITFKMNQDNGQLNIIHVANTGLDTNDGLTAGQPMQTLFTAANTILNLWSKNVLLGGWRIQLAAGTYRRATVLRSIFNAERFQVFGPPANWGEPTAIIDNVDNEESVFGLYLNGLARLHVQDVKFSNFHGRHGQGLLASRSQEMYTVNVHADRCEWAGINMSPGGVLLVSGGKITNCREGIRAYEGVTFTIGYNSQANPTVIQNCTGYGFVGYNHSSGHVDYAEISGCNVGISLINQCRADLAGPKLMGNGVGVAADSCSTYIKNTDENVLFNSGAPNTANERCRGYSIPYEHVNRFTFDPLSRQSRFGAFWSATSPISSYKYVFEQQAGDAGIAILASGTETSSLAFGRSGKGAAGRVTYDHGVDGFRVIANNAIIFHADSASFRPAADGVSVSGAPSARWSVVYAATGTINTSDEHAKQQIKPIDLACLRAWGRVEYVQYKLNDAVETKGEGARWHFGLVAQRVKEAFEAEGLNAFDYGLLCHDEWEAEPPSYDEAGVLVAPAVAAGRRFGIRYEEALALECAYLRHQLANAR
ncbi:hypothetical protein D3C76_542460 [compost metagenome]